MVAILDLFVNQKLTEKNHTMQKYFTQYGFERFIIRLRP